MADAKAKKDTKELKPAAAPVKGGKELEEKDAPEGEGEGAEGAPEGGQKFSRKKKILLFLVLPLFLIIGGGSAAYFSGLIDKLMPPKQLNCENVKEGDKDFAACAQVQDPGKDGSTPGAFLPIPDMIVNLTTTSKQPRFLKVSLKLELENAEEQKKIEPLLPRVVDQFQMYLRELRIEDLRGTSGIYRMKIELLSRVRAAAPNIKVRDVLFQEILVQ